jgi:hypothetical protein
LSYLTERQKQALASVTKCAIKNYIYCLKDLKARNSLQNNEFIWQKDIFPKTNALKNLTNRNF